MIFRINFPYCLVNTHNYSTFRNGSSGGYFVVLLNEGQNNSSALKFARRSSSGHGIGQNLGRNIVIPCSCQNKF